MIDILLFMTIIVTLVLVLVLWFQFYQFKDVEMDQLLKKWSTRVSQNRRSELLQIINYLEDPQKNNKNTKKKSSYLSDNQRLAEDVSKISENFEINQINELKSKEMMSNAAHVDSTIQSSNDNDWMNNIFDSSNDSKSVAFQEPSQLDSLLKKQNEIKKQDLVNPKGRILDSKSIEKKIARLMGEGKSTVEMATALNMSVGEIQLVQLMIKKKRMDSGESV